MAFTAFADAEAVTKVILESEELAPSARQMILEGLPNAISGEGERHAFQARFLTIVRAALADLVKSSGERQSACEVAVETARVVLEEGKTAHEEALGAKAVAAAIVEEKENILARCQEEASKTRELHAEAQGEKERVMESWNKLEGLRGEVAFLIEGPLRMLLDGGWQDEEARDTAVEAVVGYLSSVRAEPTLIAAAPDALGCKPESRCFFDKMAVDAVESLVKEKATEVAAQIEAALPEQEAVSAEALGLWALSDREDAAEKAAKSALRGAWNAQQSANLLATGAADELAERDAAVGAKLAAQSKEQEWGTEAAKALQAAERLAAFEYVPEVKPMDVTEVEALAVATEEATKDVEMADIKSKAEAPTPTHGNALGVPTPMAVA